MSQTLAPLVSAGLQPLGLHHCDRAWRGQVIDQRPAGVGVLGRGREPRREHSDGLYLAGQRADDVDAGHRHQRRHLVDADLGLAAYQELTDQVVGIAPTIYDLGLQLLGDAELVENLGDVSAALATAYCDRSCRQQRLLKLFC